MIWLVKALAVALAVLACSSFAGAATTSGRIVFAATDDPTNDDVMLVRADGSELDLSNSPAYDTAPVVAPDGKLVAFFSTRGGINAEYVVGIDGSGLRRVTPPLRVMPSVAWAPNSRELAVVAGGLFRANLAGGWARLDRRDDPAAEQIVGWSPDGTRVAYVDSNEDVRVVARDGRAEYAFSGLTAKWSPTGRLAIDRDNTIWRVYDMAGRRLSTVFAAAGLAWSPNGQLASISSGKLQIRRDGAGRPILTARPVRGASDPLWVDATHLLVRGEDGNDIYDVTHRATFLAPAAYRISPAVASDGSAYGEYPFGTLVHSKLSGSTRTVISVPYCQGKDADAFASLQALPHGSGAVFAGDCSPPHDLFSVSPGGTGLIRITSTPQDEVDPALSPDGSVLAFTRVDSADCQGCDHVVWTTKLDGSDGRSVPLPSGPENPILTDDNPSFSPDGSKLVFTRWISSVNDQAYLYEAPVVGGPATSLHVFGGYAAWGPAGIAFDGPKGVETMTSSGLRVTPVPNTVKLDDGIPAWSPAGTLALLEWDRGFFILFPATGKRLTLPGLHAPPFGRPGLTWSPDGSHLAFTAADRDGVSDVWTIGADGTGLTRVTHDLGADGALSWR